jgi:2-(1,2-epoxy-1,2-dihydrophenyl)acetyl-CoA isomerase
VTDGVSVERRDSVATVALDRPDRLNAMDDALLRGLPDVLRRTAADRSVRAIVLTGRGRAFSAGGDLFDLGPRLGGAGVEGARQHMLAYHELVRTIQSVDVPVLSAVNGSCAGAGISIAAASDLVLAERSVRFTPGFTKAGMVPDLGALYFWTEALGPRRAKELAMLGHPMTADEASAAGLVNHVVDDGTVLEEAARLATEVASGPAASYAMIKSIINAVGAGDRDRSLQLEAFAQAAAFQTGEVDEGVAAFGEKRPPVFPDRR